MNEIKIQLIDQARKQYGEILPCGRRTSIEECFTFETNERTARLALWFNVKHDDSTRVVSADIGSPN
jgi:hypothetical protein